MPLTVPPGAFPPGTILQLNSSALLVDRFLAQGGFAYVYVVRVGPGTAQLETDFGPDCPVAVLKRGAVADKESLADLEREIIFMRQLSGHKHIVKYIDSSIQKLRNGGFEVFILMEHCRGGHLVDFLNTRLSNRLTEAEVLAIFSDICEAVAHMHYSTPPIIHRDIKVENVLIANDGNYKLCDFGSATTRSIAPGTSMSGTDIRLLEEEVGKFTTLQYRAPELCDLYQKKGLTEKMDMWALGVLLYKLCFFTTPFEDSGTLAILNVRYTMPTQPSYSKHLLRIIESLLVADEASRANIYEVYSEVCKLRGVPCHLQNKYPPVVAPSLGVLPPSVTSAPIPQPAVMPLFSIDPTQAWVSAGAPGSPAGFQTPTGASGTTAAASPMRRGRPPKHVKTSSSGSINNEGSNTASLLSLEALNSPHNPFGQTPPGSTSNNRLTAPPDFFAAADFSGSGANTAGNRLTAPPSFFANIPPTEQPPSASQQPMSFISQPAYPPRRTSFNNPAMQAAGAVSQILSPLNPMSQHGSFGSNVPTVEHQPSQHTPVFGYGQTEPDPFDPFSPQIRRDSTRSIPNFKVAVGNQMGPPASTPPHLVPPRSFAKSTSEARLNNLGDSSVRIHGHSRNKSWAQQATNQYYPAKPPPGSASIGHSRNPSRDSFDSGSTASSNGVNVAGLVRQFQQTGLTEHQSSNGPYTSSSSMQMAQHGTMQPQYSSRSSFSGASTPQPVTPPVRTGSAFGNAGGGQSSPYAQQLSGLQINAPPPKPPRNLELPPSNYPLAAAFPSALPSPMTPLPPSVVSDPFVTQGAGESAWASRPPSSHGGYGWDAFNLNPGQPAALQQQQQQPTHQPHIYQPPAHLQPQQHLRSVSLGGPPPPSNDKKADDFLRGLMER
ncbi:hypothetical protein HDU87_004549 [Geranomyces variabilis]|uniref:non-specific serine/threonine protein kinase n=1 Tax=Geranomyces variabilis TaxID=109894 RepID=A0AAD5TJF4_9FUNG|nr:hypothetical protein HDU87_004549 [Geranomyces variabilis]